MKYSLTKEEVFEAILTEPVLRAGKFYDRHYDAKKGEYGKHCSACALGAVALQGLLAPEGSYIGVSKDAVAIADALIEALNEKKEG